VPGARDARARSQGAGRGAVKRDRITPAEIAASAVSAGVRPGWARLAAAARVDVARALPPAPGAAAAAADADAAEAAAIADAAAAGIDLADVDAVREGGAAGSALTAGEGAAMEATGGALATHASA
jgi:hypothetical protein